MEVKRISVFEPKKIAFGGVREDLNNISELSNGEFPLMPNKKRNILAALNNVASTPNEDNLAFLLDTASNLKYGIKGNSEFASILNSNSSASSEKENTKWNELLDNAIKSGLESIDSPRKEELTAQYSKIFNESQPLTKDQQKILKLRSKILNSNEMKSAIEDSDKLVHSAKIAENLDYFIASSEIPVNQKLECLGRMQYFLSDKFKINDQIKDKKLQALDEMLNDMVIQTPQQQALLIKQVNQRQTGMCAAISICRKALAYEDKVNYMDVLMQELNNSPYMEVFDVTKLEDQVKVPVEKTFVDFNDGLKKGYRIIDTAAHQWMHLAGTIGDGTTAVETYTPFDRENYEIYRDSKWYAELDDQFKPAQNFLRLLIKERSELEDIYKIKESQKKIQQKIGDYKNDYLKLMERSGAALVESVKKLSPEMTPSQARIVSKGILNLKKLEDSDLKIHSNESDEAKKQKIEKYIKSQVANVSDEAINDNIKSIFSMYKEYSEANETLEKLNSHNKLKSIYSYNNKLFMVAAIHRKAVEAELNMENKIGLYEQSLGLPPREIQYENQVKAMFNKLNSPQKVEELAKAYNVEPTKVEVEKALNSQLKDLQVLTPLQMDSILNRMSMGNRATVLKSFLANIQQNVKAGDPATIAQFAQNSQIKNDQLTVESKVNSYIKMLENSPNNKQMAEISRALGYQDQLDLVVGMYQVFVSMLSQGLTPESQAAVMKNLGNPLSLKKAIDKLANEIDSIDNKYLKLEKQLNIPTRQELVLKKLEANGEVLPKNSIDSLQERFDKGLDERIRREKLKETGVKLNKNLDMYKFSPEENALFEAIETNLSKTRKYANFQYKMMNAYLEPELTKLYGETGKLSGSFWIQEEGHSGLPDHQSIRIFEQMTGQPYYVEKDINKAVEDIKKGEGSGTSCTSVLNTEYALHAQYVPEISSVEMIDAKTKEKVVKEVLWHDNSWGKVEDEGKWLADDGLYHTDYEAGYGNEDGYIFGNDFKTGTLVSDLNTKFGVLKEDSEKFPLFFSMIMPGVSPVAYQKLNELFTYIFQINNSKGNLNKLEEKINSGARINIKQLEELDEECERVSEKYTKRIDKELVSKEALDKLPENDLLKFFVEKLAIYKSTTNPEIQNMVLEVMTREELDELKQDIKETQRGYFEDIFNKSDNTLEFVSVYAKPYLDMELSKASKKYGIDFGNIEEFEKQLFNIPPSKLDGTLTGLESMLTYNIYKQVGSKVANKETEIKVGKEIVDIVRKVLSTNISINSLDDLYVGNEMIADSVVKWIDKEFNPRTDAELIKVMKQLQNMKKPEFKALMDKMTEEDLGIKYQSPYDSVEKLRAQNEEYEKGLGDIINTFVIINGLPDKGENEDSPEALYRDAYIKLSNIDVDKYIRKFKAQVFDKYHSRPAFPQIAVVADKDIAECVNENLQAMSQYVSAVSSQNYIIDTLREASKVRTVLLMNPVINNPESLKNVSAAIDSLYEKTQKDPSLETVNQNLIAIKKELGAGSGRVDYKKVNDLYKNVTAVFSEFNDVNNVNVETLSEASLQVKEDLASHIDLFTKTNILPKYQDEVRHLAKLWVKEYSKNPDSQQTNIAHKNLLDVAVKRHITKEPNDLLHSYINELQSEDKNEEVAKALRYYMDLAVETAQLAKVEYKLVKNENAGISSNTADLLEMFHVTMPGGQKYTMKSDEGISYLINQLASKNNDYSTMKLFFTQTGLGEKAIEVIIKDFKPAAVLKFMKSMEKTVESSLNNNDLLSDLYQQFEDNNNIQYQTYEDASKHLVSYVEKYYPSKTKEEQELFNIYKKYMETASQSDICKTIEPNMILPNLAQVHQGALEVLGKRCNSAIEELNDVNNILNERAALVNSLDLSENSPMFYKREKFLNTLEKLREQQQICIQNVNEVVRAFNSKYQE